MDIREQLRLLQTAEGDPARLALATVDLAFPTLSDGERTELKTALEAASLPHWCDADLLAALLEVPVQASRERLSRLRRLKVLEPFPARGEQAVNVHEAARLDLRRWLIAHRPESFRTWSQRAAEHFAADPSPAARIEWIYHRLGYDPDRAATELECLNRDWSGSARPEDRQALAIALQELLAANALDGRARVWAMLCVAWARDTRGETAQLGDQARAILDLAADIRDRTAIADAQCLVGDVLQAQGKLSEAQAAFGEYLAISRRLVEQDPGNASWQRSVGVAHSRVGDVVQAQGKLFEAQAAFGEDLAICRRLAEQDPSNAGWQRDLAVAHSRVGAILQAQGRLGEAQAAFGEDLGISRRLAEQDPSNAEWQRDLALGCSRVAGLLKASGRYQDALPLYEEAARIFVDLVERCPDFAAWSGERDTVQRELELCRDNIRKTP